MTEETTESFTLDRFQLEAIAALDLGSSVLVAAPTGSGKTVVADAAIDLALHAGGRAFYTTPIKALSNQKFGDLCRRLGPDRVGLLTGDNSIRGDAPVVVMTTEVLRNMIYGRRSSLDDLHVVILDEVHYLQDAYRGPVWEEVIIHLASSVRLVCLSATVSNATELGDWLEAVRGPTETVIETERPVELHPLYLVGDRAAADNHLMPILIEGRPNPEGTRFAEDPRLARRTKGRVRRRFYPPRRAETVERLAREDLLPAIYFIFSRAACEDALAYCRDAGLRLTTPGERTTIRHIVDEAVKDLTDDDLDVLGYDLWLAALEMGVAAHHAGMVPIFKEAVESCFAEGLVKVVFATETLALGINMPARSVVIEKLSKFNGEGHEFLTPGEFTQLTGRAGRRGIDEVGYAIVAWSPFVTFEQVAALVSSRSFQLTSSFRPTYNMAANLIERYSREEAFEILGQSFAQFQADRALVGLQRRLHDDRHRLTELDAVARCERGDAVEYRALVVRLERERHGNGGVRAAVEMSAAMLRPGDLVDLPAVGNPRLPSIVISVAHRGKGAIRIRAVDGSGDVHSIDARDLSHPIYAMANVELPSPYSPDQPDFLDACAQLVVDTPAPPARHSIVEGEPDPLASLEAAILTHPVNRCPDRDRHCAALVELAKLSTEMDHLSAAVAKRSGSVARRFEAVLDLLDKEGFASGWSLTASGRRLASIYHEGDLVIAEAVGAGLFDGLDHAELAAVASTLTYEERRADAPPGASIPSRKATKRIEELGALARRIRRAERSRGLPLTREPDTGLAAVAHGWASGDSLEGAVADLPAGDFVRNIKLLIDLLRQVGDVASDPVTAATARSAAEEMSRGVVTAGDVA